MFLNLSFSKIICFFNSKECLEIPTEAIENHQVQKYRSFNQVIKWLFQETCTLICTKYWTSLHHKTYIIYCIKYIMFPGLKLIERKPTRWLSRRPLPWRWCSSRSSCSTWSSGGRSLSLSMVALRLGWVAVFWRSHCLEPSSRQRSRSPDRALLSNAPASPLLSRR